MCVCMCVYVCVYVYVCVCIHVYVCMHTILGGIVRRGNVLPKTGGGIVRGGIVQGEMSYTHLISLSQCSSLIMPVQPLQRLKKEGGAANNTCNDTACLMSNYPTKDRQKARRLLRRKRSIDYIDKSSSWSC